MRGCNSAVIAGQRLPPQVKSLEVAMSLVELGSQPVFTCHATGSTTTSPDPIGREQVRSSARVATWAREPAIHATQHATRATTTSLTSIDSELQRPLARAASRKRLRDHGLGARTASWTRQTAIHAAQHATRPATTSPTHIGDELQ